MDPTDSRFAGKERLHGSRLGRALIALAETQDGKSLARILAECGFEPVLCSSAGEAREAIASGTIRIVFCGEGIAGGGCRDVLRAAHSGGRNIPVIVCSRLYNTRDYLNVMEMGAYDFLISPYDKTNVAWIAEGALRNAQELPRWMADHAA
jgi:DNA-binding NtrC family response regulator